MINFDYEFNRIDACCVEFAGIIKKAEEDNNYLDTLCCKTNEIREELYVRIGEEEKTSTGYLNPDEAEIAFHQFEKLTNSVQEDLTRSLTALEMYLKADVRKLSKKYRAVLWDYLLEVKKRDFSDEFGIINTLPIPSILNQDKPFTIKGVRSIEWPQILEKLTHTKDSVYLDNNLISLKQLAKESFRPIRESVYKNTAAFKYYAHKQFSLSRLQTETAFYGFMYADLALKGEGVGDG